MPNTTEENQLAQTSFRLIAAKYTKYFMNTSVQGFAQAMLMGSNVEAYVKFRDQAAFLMNFNASGGTKTANCRTLGFTSYRAGSTTEREIFINRTLANSTTIVHEMLHFLTHPTFWHSVPQQTTEAVTEYFTRKVIGHGKNANFTLDMRKGRYDVHHQILQMGRNDVKENAVRPKKGYMKEAYFRGDRDCIAFVLMNLNFFDDMDE